MALRVHAEEVKATIEVTGNGPELPEKNPKAAVDRNDFFLKNVRTAERNSQPPHLFHPVNTAVNPICYSRATAALPVARGLQGRALGRIMNCDERLLWL